MQRKHKQPLPASTPQDTKKIPRPLNSFMLFRLDIQNVVSNHCPGANHRDISKVISQWWREMDYDTKSVYVKRAESIKREHKIRFPDYKFSPVRKAKSKRSYKRQGEDRDVVDRSAKARRHLYSLYRDVSMADLKASLQLSSEEESVPTTDTSESYSATSSVTSSPKTSEQATVENKRSEVLHYSIVHPLDTKPLQVEYTSSSKISDSDSNNTCFVPFTRTNPFATSANQCPDRPVLPPLRNTLPPSSFSGPSVPHDSEHLCSSYGLPSGSSNPSPTTTKFAKITHHHFNAVPLNSYAQPSNNGLQSPFHYWTPSAGSELQACIPFSHPMPVAQPVFHAHSIHRRLSAQPYSVQPFPHPP